MLRMLSRQNARRQFREYLLFYVTLTCLSAAMYAFFSLMFSEPVTSLPDMEILPWMIAAATGFLIFLIGWIVGYMIRYMLKRRSREFALYMLSGITSRGLGALVSLENLRIGLIAFLSGILPGLLFAQLLEAVLLHMFGLPYALHFGLSPAALFPAFLSFALMLLYAGRKNRRWIRRATLREMLDYDRQNETSPVVGSAASVAVFFLSLLACAAGFLLLTNRPFGQGYDILLGTVCLILFVTGFFLSVPAFLVRRFENRTDWKYAKHRLIAFRGFTAKIHSTSIVMGMLSALFLLSVTFAGIGITVNLMVTEQFNAGVFDLMILHEGELSDFSRYENLIRRDYPLTGYSYGIYTDGRTDFLSVYDQVVLKTGRALRRPWVESAWDPCIRQSDYQKLRALLHYEPVTLSPSLCYVHCLPALKKDVEALIRQDANLHYGEFSFAKEGVFTEPFSQMNDYGNGAGYLLIIPDEAAAGLRVLYSVYAGVTDAPLQTDALSQIASDCGLTPLDRSTGTATPTGAPTAFTVKNTDYLSGRWMDKAELHYLYSIVICLFYLAVLLEIIGAAVLSTQVLSDRQAKKQQERILRQLGMSEGLIRRQRNRQLSFLFLFPLLPAAAASVC